MNRNAESHFALNPTRMDMPRSTFDRASSVKTSFNVGEIVPFYIDEVLPGDTFKVKTSKVIRMQTLLTPMMDNVYLDTYFFFVPNRLVWEHWREFMGENTQSAWIPETEYEVPQITAPDDTGFAVGTIADYMGIPTGVPGLSVNALPFRGYSLIVNDWFRDENLQDPLLIPMDDATVEGVNTANFVTDVAKGGKPFIAAKYHDYFTSALPSPQKGPDVTIPVATAGNLPVVALTDKVPNQTSTPMVSWASGAENSKNWMYEKPLNDTSRVYTATSFSDALGNSGSFQPANLWAISSGEAVGATINQLRLAFQIQKFYERNARGGTRYIELLKSHFGVTSPDARMQRPEYLGGNRVPINVNQIVQQSATGTGDTPQGTVVGMSLTTDTNDDFVKSFTEHGFVFGLVVARYDHTYQQGLDRMWSRKDKFDYYWPVFANIGEMGIKNSEIYAQGTAEDNEIFGYQEAWADYRYKPNRVSGEMRSSYAQSLDVWHLADDYTQLPALSDSWIREDKNTVDRVLAVTSENSNQLFMDCYVQNWTTRPMPMYSIPGLIDHF